jgi:hypothetical protein
MRDHVCRLVGLGGFEVKRVVEVRDRLLPPLRARKRRRRGARQVVWLSLVAGVGGRPRSGGPGKRDLTRRRLGARHEPQLRPVPFRLEHGRLPLAGQILEAVGSSSASWNSRRCTSLISQSGG